MKNNTNNSLKLSKLFGVFLVPIFSLIILYQVVFVFFRLIFFGLLHLLQVIFDQVPFSFNFINQTFDILIPHSLIISFTFFSIVLVFLYFNKIFRVKHIYKLIRFILFLGYIIIPLYVEFNGGTISKLVNEVISFQIFDLIDTKIMTMLSLIVHEP